MAIEENLESSRSLQAEPGSDPLESAIEIPVINQIDASVNNTITEIPAEPITPTNEEVPILPVAEQPAEPIVTPDLEQTEEPVTTIPIVEPSEPATEPVLSDSNASQTVSPTQQVIINEIMTGSEINPEKDAWIELFNPNNEEINLSGWQIKGVTSGGRWIDIVNDTNYKILPNGYYLISYYTNSSYSALNVKPQIQKSSLLFPNELIEIELKDLNGNLSDKALINNETVLDFRSYERTCPINSGELSESWSRATARVNIKESALNTYATPNSANSVCQTSVIPQETIVPITEGEDGYPHYTDETQITVTIQPIVTKTYPSYQLINEIMVNPEGDDELGEWIELYNNTSSQIDLSGWYLDDAEGDSSPFKINENTLLGAGSYLVLSAPNLKLSLKNSDDQVRLLDPNKEVKEIISYFGAKENWCYAKKPDGGFIWSPILTPGYANMFPSSPKSYYPDDIILKSVLPNPEGEDEGGEIIIIKNNLGESVDLSTWKIMNLKGREFQLGNIVIEPFQIYNLMSSNISLSLVNKADELSLIDPSGNMIDRISWTGAKNGEIIYKSDFFQDGFRGKVIRVIDGDTFVASINGDEYTIRLIGVDTPETVNPKKEIEKYGKEASDYLNNTLSGQTVILGFDENKTDVYNRLLAYVYLGNIFVNADIIQKGYGYAYTRFPFKYETDFIKYENLARENRLGIWNDKEIAKIIKQIKDDEDIKYVENKDLLVNNENKENTEINSDNEYENLTCLSNNLRIDSILPNAEKGKSVEYIKIINNGAEKACLTGWTLDDDLERGSKPFEIKGGSIQPGAIRTFRQSETHLNLNNDADCVNLINPNTEVADQICYKKAHKNEIFTHDGGDWEPKKKTVKLKVGLLALSGAEGANPATTRPKRDSTDYQWELKNETIDGKIAFIYKEGEIIYLQTNNETIPVSYANSKVNIDMAKQMLDFNSPVRLDVRLSGDERELIAINQEKIPDTENGNLYPRASVKLPTEIKYIIGLLIIVSSLCLIKKFNSPR